MKICHLETVMRESPRSPALLVEFISEENAHNSYPGVSKRYGPMRGERQRTGGAMESRLRCVCVCGGSEDEPRTVTALLQLLCDMSVE